MRRCAIHLLFALSVIAGVGVLPFQSPASGARAAAPYAPQAADPLPGGCGRVTPPGEAGPVCCISGFVYMDGQPIAGAEVQVRNRNGGQVTLVTQLYSDSATPYYRLNLTAPPLEVQEGAPITVTARYSGHERSLSYTVRGGGQQVDVVLARPQREGYVFERQIWGQAEPRQFNGPTGLAVDGEGNIYVVDSDNARVQVFGSDKQFRWQWGTRGNLPGQFLNPIGIALDGSGNVYVADTGNSRIQKFSRTGQLITAWGGYGSDDGQFIEPIAVAADASDNIYVVDPWNNRIKKFSSTGQFRTSWDYNGGDIDAAVDSSGDLYILGSSSIRKFSANGDLLDSWEGAFQADEPGGIAVAADGTAYVTDNSRILVFSDTLDLRETWSLTGVSGFYAHGDIVAGHHGYLYAADVAGNKILILDPTKDEAEGKVVDTWGDYGRASGQLKAPAGVDVDRDGNIYVADTENDRLQKFSRNGTIDVWRGPVGTSLRFDAPYAITVDNGGKLYVVDQNPSDQSNRLWKLDRDGRSDPLWPAEGVLFGAIHPGDAQVGVDSGGSLYLAHGSQVLKLDSSGAPIASWGSFGHAMGIAVDSTDGVYVSDSTRHQIQRFAGDGAPLGPPWPTQGSGDGQLDGPTRLRLDSAGNVYVVDAGNRRIQKFSASGEWKAAWGSPGIGAGLLGEYLGEVGVDTSGRVSIADSANNRVQVFRPLGFTRPIATINYLSATSLAAGERLTAYGMGQDSDETPEIAAYRWASDRDGVIGHAATLSATAGLSPGLHRLTFAVQDGEGEWSDPVGTRPYLVGPASAPGTMLL
jgi:DNA-binding beta-propeller fold protein YncE